MKDYARIALRIRESNWLITPESLSVILEIMNKRISGEHFTDEEIRFRLEDAGISGNGISMSSQEGVGVLPLTGPIFAKASLLTEMSGATSLETFQNNFRAMLDNDLISSILLNIDSPGGTSDLVQETGDMIMAGRDVKPIYALANTNAGSAAYWLMSQASSAYVTPSGSVGSIGAYTVHEDQSVADTQAGKRFSFISAGPHKTEGNPHEPLSQEARQFRQQQVDQLYSQFVEAVASGRGVDSQVVKDSFGGGRMYQAQDALDAGMVDGILSYDQLIGQLTTPNRSQNVQVQMNGATVAAVMQNGVINLESADWEHSEPGSGPVPRTAQTVPDPGTGQPVITPSEDVDDKAIVGGWRRNLPTAPDVQARNMERSNMSEEQIAELYKLLGVDNDDAFLAKVADMHSQVSTLEEATQSAFSERKFASDYPEIWEEHQALKADRVHSNASDFAESIARFKSPQVDGTLSVTNTGLSALAVETVMEAHKKFAMGTGTVEDFQIAMKAVTEGGTVNYSELGSDRSRESLEIDVSNSVGMKNAKTMFAEKIAEIQKEDGLDYRAALSIAAQRYPDLAEAYNAVPNA